MKKEHFMKNLLLTFCFVSILGFCSGAIYSHIYNNNNVMFAGRGCCSSHGGVCGCAKGRSKCCDGTLSPSCHCFRDENKGFQI